MFQIVEAFTTTATRLAEQHGPKVAMAVVAFVVGGVVLRLLYRVLSAGGRGQ
jgi:hypothetical protein